MECAEEWSALQEYLKKERGNLCTIDLQEQRRWRLFEQFRRAVTELHQLHSEGCQMAAVMGRVDVGDPVICEALQMYRRFISSHGLRVISEYMNRMPQVAHTQTDAP